MDIPGWLTLALLAGAATRTFMLIAEDTILDRPRAWLLGLPHGWAEGDPVPRNYREKLAMFITCSRCAGFWGCAAWWGAWQLWPHWTEVVATPFALSLVLVLVHHNGLSDE